MRTPLDTLAPQAHTGGVGKKRWPWITVAEFCCMFWAVEWQRARLSRPPKVMPPIVPGRPQDFGR